MTIHLGSKQCDIAEVVLLPGDPLRAKWAAENFLTDIKKVNEVRGMLGYTGIWNGNQVTIQGTGMGMPSLSIYVNELIKDYAEKEGFYYLDYFSSMTDGKNGLKENYGNDGVHPNITGYRVMQKMVLKAIDKIL